jgi:predicted nucleic acid-binding protein
VIFVLDASVTMCWLFLDGKPAERTYALSVLDAMKQSETRALVPVTWGLEISNVIGKAETRGSITEAQSESFLEMLGSMDISADTATFSKALSDTLQISRRHRISAYDASYLVLAMREGLPLATLDEDLQKAASKAGLKRFVVR